MLYYEKPYFVVPADDLAEEAFIVLREALKRTHGRSGSASWRMRGREYVVSLKPCGRGMVLETLRYADEVNKAQGYFRDIPDSKPDAELLEPRRGADREEDRRPSIPRTSTTTMSMRSRA